MGDATVPRRHSRSLRPDRRRPRYLSERDAGPDAAGPGAERKEQDLTHAIFGTLTHHTGEAFYDPATVDREARPVYLSKARLDSGISRLRNEDVFVRGPGAAGGRHRLPGDAAVSRHGPAPVGAENGHGNGRVGVPYRRLRRSEPSDPGVELDASGPRQLSPARCTETAPRRGTTTFLGARSATSRAFISAGRSRIPTRSRTR